MIFQKLPIRLEQSGEMNILNKLISLFSNKKKAVTDTVCCSGCKHLFYWNDGSVGCDIEKEYICIPNGFIFREK